MKNERDCGNRLRNARNQWEVGTEGIYNFLSPGRTGCRNRSASLAGFRKKAQSFIHLLTEEGFAYYCETTTIAFDQPKDPDKLKNLFSVMVLWANDLIRKGLLYAPDNYEVDTLKSLPCIVGHEFYHSPYGRMPLDET